MEKLLEILPQLLAVAGAVGATAVALGFSATHAWLQFKYCVEDPIEVPLFRLQYLRTGMWLLAFTALSVLVILIAISAYPCVANLGSESGFPTLVAVILIMVFGERLVWRLGKRTARYAWRTAPWFTLGVLLGAVVAYVSGYARVPLLGRVVPPCHQFALVVCFVTLVPPAVRWAPRLEGLRSRTGCMLVRLGLAGRPDQESSLAALVKSGVAQARNIAFYLLVFLLLLSIVPLHLAVLAGAQVSWIPSSVPGWPGQLPTAVMIAICDIFFLCALYWSTIMFYGPVCMDNLNLSEVTIHYRPSDHTPVGLPDSGLLLVERPEEFIVFRRPARTPAELQGDTPARLHFIPKELIASLELTATWRGARQPD